MICPNCKHRVDPNTTDNWLGFLLKKIRASHNHTPTPKEVLKAVYMWDQSDMAIDGHSILPTELRDFVHETMSKE